VGTIIVAAVAIIFLPDVLDGDKKTYQDNFEAIPTAPKIDFPVADRKFPKERISRLSEDKLSDERAFDETNSIDSSKLLAENGVAITTLAKEDDFSAVKNSVKAQKTLEKEIKKSPSKAVAKQAWAIQLGSFRHQNNVDELVNKLKGNGYTVFTRPIKTKNGKLTKVFVGPELIKSSLDKKLSALKKLTNVQGKVARFYPTK
jgi:DedD protein